MLLKRFIPLQSERGSAMVAVIGVLAVGLILSTLIMASIVSGLGWSTFSRASVQSHASADAGIVAARIGLFNAGDCNTQSTSGVYVSASSPSYRVTVERNDGSGWVAGCPTALTTQVRLTSTGTAAAPAVAGVSAGDSTSVEAVYEYLRPGVNPSGVAVYVHNDFTVEANSSFDLSEAGSTGLIVKNGTFTCDKNNSVINGSVVVIGNLTFDGKCTVTGSAEVSGLATLGAGQINGDLSAAAVNPNPPGSKVGGTYTQTSVVPPAPDWVNLTYKPTDWVTAAGLPYEVKTVITPGQCKLVGGNLGGTVPGYPMILDALGCADGLTLNQNTVIKMTSDIVIFANKFDFPQNNGLTFQSSSTAAHRLWLITPDNGPAGDKAPTCDPVTQGLFDIKNTFEIKKPIAAMLYTPCGFSAKNTFVFNGQIYAGGESDAKNNPAFTFVPMGAAGVDFDSATTPKTITKPQPGGLLSMRDISHG